MCHGNILYENDTDYEGNRSVITGIPLGCSETGLYGAFCRDGTIQPSTASAICALYGFPGQLQDIVNSFNHEFPYCELFVNCKLAGGKYDYSNRTIFEEIVWYNNFSCEPGPLSSPELCHTDQVPTCESGPLGLTCYISGMCFCHSKNK